MAVKVTAVMTVPSKTLSMVSSEMLCNISLISSSPSKLESNVSMKSLYYGSQESQRLSQIIKILRTYWKFSLFLFMTQALQTSFAGSTSSSGTRQPAPVA